MLAPPRPARAGAATAQRHQQLQRSSSAGTHCRAPRRLYFAASSSAAGAGAGGETISFVNQRNEVLVGSLEEPPSTSSDAGTVPVVVLAHGYMSSRHSELLVRLSTALRRSCGLSTFRFDFSGNGDSGGRFRYGGYRSEAAELQCARQHLEGALHRRVVATIGHSKGGTDVLLHAASPEGSSLACAVNLAGRFDLAAGVERRLGADVLHRLEAQGQVEMRGSNPRNGAFTWQLLREDLQDRLSTDMAAACAAISVPVLTVHGDADADVPVADARRFDEHIQNHELAIIRGGDHCFASGDAMYQLAAAVLPFISRHVAAAAITGQ